MKPSPSFVDGGWLSRGAMTDLAETLSRIGQDRADRARLTGIVTSKFSQEYRAPASEPSR